MKIYNILMITGILAFVSCKSTKSTVVLPPPNCVPTNYTYEVDIKPILQESCTRCHNSNNKAGYNFNDLESVKKAGGNGFLLGTIKHQSGFDPMPRMSGPLDQSSIDKIECWIKNGMK